MTLVRAESMPVELAGSNTAVPAENKAVASAENKTVVPADAARMSAVLVQIHC